MEIYAYGDIYMHKRTHIYIQIHKYRLLITHIRIYTHMLIHMHACRFLMTHIFTSGVLLIPYMYAYI